MSDRVEGMLVILPDGRRSFLPRMVVEAHVRDDLGTTEEDEVEPFASGIAARAEAPAGSVAGAMSPLVLPAWMRLPE